VQRRLALLPQPRHLPCIASLEPNHACTSSSSSSPPVRVTAHGRFLPDAYVARLLTHTSTDSHHANVGFGRTRDARPNEAERLQWGRPRPFECGSFRKLALSRQRTPRSVNTKARPVRATRVVDCDIELFVTDNEGSIDAYCKWLVQVVSMLRQQPITYMSRSRQVYKMPSLTWSHPLFSLLDNSDIEPGFPHSKWNLECFLLIEY